MTPREQATAKAKLDPRAQFDSPMDVVRDDKLTRAQKREILDSWELDARELQTAADENMAGGEADRLAEVRQALRELEKRGPETAANEKRGASHGD